MMTARGKKRLSCSGKSQNEFVEGDKIKLNSTRDRKEEGSSRNTILYCALNLGEEGK